MQVPRSSRPGSSRPDIPLRNIGTEWGKQESAEADTSKPNCPECGRPFRPSDHEFVPNAVRFCCPECDQDYYGTGHHARAPPAPATPVLLRPPTTESTFPFDPFPPFPVLLSASFLRSSTSRFAVSHFSDAFLVTSSACSAVISSLTAPTAASVAEV